MFVMAAFVGYSTGNAAMGPIAASFIPIFGWPVVFAIAGGAGTLLALVLLLFLPESIPFLAATKPGALQLRRLVARAAPDIALAADTRFVLKRPVSEMKFSLKLLFADERRIVTPLLWLAFFAETLTYITLSSWLAVLLERAGLAPQTASVVYGYAALGAVAAILLVGRLLDRFGPRASVLSALIAVTATVALGTPGLTSAAIVVFAIFAMGFGSATHNSLLGIVGGFYPTIVRGNGVGFAASMGRVAAIFGPGIAGYLLARLPLQYVLICIAAPDLIVAAICVALARYRDWPSRVADETRVATTAD
jgi:AAHS family 4-hydroxybenzoate transporter-like MFS transporter